MLDGTLTYTQREDFGRHDLICVIFVRLFFSPTQNIQEIAYILSALPDFNDDGRFIATDWWKGKKPYGSLILVYDGKNEI